MDNFFPPGADVKVWNQNGDHLRVEPNDKYFEVELCKCKANWCAHGQIKKSKELVCPGDFIVRGSDGEYHSFHPETIAKGAE